MALNTIVLRFSNFSEQYDTYEEHVRIINSGAGVVWWGWWKKTEEPWKGNALEELSKMCPRTIGLANRLAKKFYTATCERIIIGAGGELRGSPSPELTPEYYRDSKHPAWFRLSSIVSVDESAFVHDFAGVPQGDPTLYVVEQGPYGLRLKDEDFSEPSIIHTQGDSILHLSDLHFGEDHAFEPETVRYPFIKPSLADKVAEIVAGLPDYKIGVLVVSGDLITEGESKGFDVAELFLSTLLQKLGLSKEHVVIVPGNHDIYIKDFQEDAYRYDPEVGYRRFTKGFLGYGDIERLQRFQTPSGWRLSFLSLNSSRLREKSLMNYGFVGKDKYEPFLKMIHDRTDGKSAAELARQKVLNFAVLHHHVLPVQGIDTPPKNEPVSLTIDAGQLISNLQSSKTHFVLHGHQHEPFLGTTGRVCSLAGKWADYKTPLVVVGCGSSGAKSNRLPDVLRNNTLGIYTPRDREFEVRMEQFNPTIPAELYMRLSIPI